MSDTVHSKHFQDQTLNYAHETDKDRQLLAEESIWKEYGHSLSVFVLDMSGFSLLTRRYGVVHYLSMVYRMRIMSEPIINQHRGRVVKFEADNCFAVFPDVLQAVNAGVALNKAFEA